MNTKELEQIIENHRHWIYEDVDGWEVMCANLSDVDMSCANLSGTNLRRANLSGANLRWADLSGTDLRGADMRFTNLSGANLSDAILSGANLRDANMRNVNLNGANLWCTELWNVNLKDATLRGSNLRNTNLRGADLRRADMKGTDLRSADMRGAILSTAENVPYIPMICPEEGDFIGYKKACNKIVKLLIPKDAKRSSATTRKCRCNKALVLAIYELDGSISKATEVVSNRDHNFVYKINKEVVVDDFDNDRWNECSTGIHFFMQKQEAINYII